KRTANWVAWRLRASDIGSVPRGDFHVDPVIPTPSPSDYTNSGYERGHLCPSGDRTNTSANNYAVFSMINIIPQLRVIIRVHGRKWIHTGVFCNRPAVRFTLARVEWDRKAASTELRSQPRPGR